MNILIKNGRIIDPANKIDAVSDLLLEDGLIKKITENIKIKADTEINASGKIVAPGLIDMHVHLREPGREDKETVASGTYAAAKGGITTVLAMPNTLPAMDSVENIKLLQGIIEKSALINVFICGAITVERLGQALSGISGLKNSGALAISDDGSSVDSDELMFEAFKKAEAAGIITICHCEDKKLSAKGVMNLGFNSTRLGLRGICRESEILRISRDIELANKAKARVHIAHISCAESVEISAKAKKKGIMVTCETAPHYFSLTEDALLNYDTNMKMNPPLRTENDLLAIKQGLIDGVIDVIASDHAPHTENEKDIEFERAEFGVVGLETELSVGLSELVGNKSLDLSRLIEKLSWNPAKILGLGRGTLGIGKPADIVIFSPTDTWEVKKEQLVSKSKNSAFLGKTLKGIVEYTICNGDIAYKRFPLSRE